jgi:hypothetical protein
MSLKIMNLATPKAGVRHEPLFNKTASEVSAKLELFIEDHTSEAGLLNKSSCLAATLGEAKFINVTDRIWVILCCAT